MALVDRASSLSDYWQSLGPRITSAAAARLGEKGLRVALLVRNAERLAQRWPTARSLLD